ncbi:General secretion pathway protein GspL [Rubrivivax sp. A210]|uniref:type II secretion system protein GspL n=1 Tax=Rubrivivax sp. A210 TaxID=2772301 RepID=UPI001918F2D6|nr:type II secretion system protein GspL [Rubrivivax sp. A210]CAD5372567.1 General secretion pathway protein GspL [Rubrivivax sp. A210]
MSLLVIQLPPRERLGARAAGSDAAAAARLPQEWFFVLSADGRSVTQSGTAATALLPRADASVLVLAEDDVAWQRVAVPKAPASRLRAALAGTMEEALLDGDEAVHLALGPDAAPGREGWVAVTQGPRLAAALVALEAAGPGVQRVVPASLPLVEGRVRGHFYSRASEGEDAAPWLSLARADGVACTRLAGTLARALLPADAEAAVNWSATPAAAAAAEHWLGRPVPLLGEAERLLEAAQAAVNLRQFDLAAQTRGTRKLADVGRRLLSREWRPVRWGLAALMALQLVGLNVHAWQQRQAIAAKREAMNALLRTAHPGVRVVLDAPVQMERETDRLRAAAGRPGEADLEALMAAAAAAWPDGQGPVQNLRFENGRLTLAAGAWGEPQVQQFRQRLRGGGYAAEFAEGRVNITRAAAPKPAAGGAKT